MGTNKYKFGKFIACIRKSLCAKASLSVRDVFFLFYRQHQRFVLLLFTHQWTYSFHTVPSVSVLTIYHSYHAWDIFFLLLRNSLASTWWREHSGRALLKNPLSTNVAANIWSLIRFWGYNMCILYFSNYDKANLF